jgi:hypothetical protein
MLVGYLLSSPSYNFKFMERFYDVTVNGQAMRLGLHSTTVVPDGDRARIEVHVDSETLTETLPTDTNLQFDAAGQAAHWALASVAVTHVYPDQSYEEILRLREAAQHNQLS